jgi:hypothetical protein
MAWRKQKDFQVTKHIEFSVWYGWDQPGLGITSMIQVGDIKLLVLWLGPIGLALTFWPRWKDGQD